MRASGYRSVDVHDRLVVVLGWILGVSLGLLVLAQAPTFLWQDVVIPKLLVLRVATIVLLLGIAALTATGDRRVRPPWYCVVGGLFLLWALVPTLLSESRHLSFFGAVFRHEGWLGFAGYFVVFWAARLVASGRAKLGTVAGPALVTCAVLVTGLALLQHFWPGGRSVPLLGLGDWEQRSFGTFGNPLFLGLFGCLVVPVLLAVFRSASGAMARLAVLVVLGGLIMATVFTYSRASWVGLAVGMVVAAFLVYRRERVGWLVVAALLVFAFALPTTLDRLRQVEAPADATVIGRVTATLQGGGSLATRVELYKATLPLIAEKPVQGWGFETYLREGARARTERLVRLEGDSRAFADRPHSSVLYMAYSTGLIGLGLYLVFLGGVLLAGYRNYRSAGGSDKWLIAGLLGGLVGYFIAELGSFTVIEVTPLAFAALGWVSAGRITRGATADVDGCGAAPDHFGGRGPASNRAVAAGAVIGVVALVGAPFVLGQAVDVARADRLHYQNTRTTQDMSRFPELVAVEQRASKLDPFNSYVWNVLGTMFLDAGEQIGNHQYVEEARAAFVEGLLRLPDDPNLTVSLSDLELRDGRPSEAVKILTAYLARDPLLEDAHFNLGLAYLQLGQPKQAVAQFEECVRIVPSDAEAYYYLARAYQKSGDAEAAARAVETAKRLDPEGRLSGLVPGSGS